MDFGTGRFWKRILMWVGAMILFSIAINSILRGGLFGAVFGLAIIVGGALIFLNKDRIVAWYENIREQASGMETNSYNPPAKKSRKQTPQSPENERRPPLSQYEENTWESIVKDLQDDKDNL